jgi:amino acid adenylation domain-containing protein
MSREHIHDWVSRVAAGARERTAIDAGDRPVSYGALEDRSSRIAAFLLASGLEKGAVVAIVADDVPAIVASILGVLKAGGVFVPLDPRTPERRLRALIAEVSARWFISQEKFASLVGAVAGARPRVLLVDGPLRGSACPLIDVLDGFDTFDGADRRTIERDADDACYVYFTSGSTGAPKGITGRLKAIDHYVRWEISTFGIGAADRVTQLTTPSFDASLRDFFTPLAAGGTVCVPPPGTVLDADKLVEWLDDQRITIVHCVPSVFRAIVNQGLDGGRFPQLRAVLMAGEAILPADASRWYDAFGTRIELVNLYGPSETTMTKFFHRVTPDDVQRRLIPIGRPMTGAAALVADEHGHPCPAGVVGEIYIRTPYRSLGYFGRDELTRAVFIPNPFGSDPNDLVYRTGDLGRMLKDGAFELIGRRDHQVKVRGERIELGAVEAALRGHAAVKDVAVVDREDAAGTKYLAAYVVLGDDARAADLREHLSHELSAAAIPSAFVVLDQLPRLINGKVDRAALPAPDEQPREGRALEDPRTPLETELAALFCEVLGIGRIGVHESFFELGGHSLLATQLVSRVRRALQVALPVRTLFDAPTVAGVAEHVEALRWAAQGTATQSAARTEIEI